MSTAKLRDAAIGLLYLVLIAALVLLSIMIYNKDFSTTVGVDLHTDNIGSSLQRGSDVMVRGVLVGDVKRISTDGDGADIRLSLDPGKAKQLPANVTAQLLPKTLFGERYVSLVFPDEPSSQHLRSGDSIRQDTSAHSVEVQKLFTDLLPVLQAVQPQKLESTLGELATALRGEGGDLADTLRTVGGYLTQLAPQVPQLTDDIAKLATVADTYTSATPQLIDALTSFTTTSQTIVAQRQNLTDLLASATSMADVVGGFVGTNKNQIIGLSNDSLPTLKILNEYAAEFPCVTRALTDFVPVSSAAFGAGTASPGAHIILHVVAPTKPYTAADRPSFAGGGAARCPYTPTTALASTALAVVPGVQGANSTPVPDPAVDDPAIQSAPALGPVNSPEENQLIAELVAPTAGMDPADFPSWSSLLLGPALRGTEVSLR
jgi:phospholipid/cholesterol/gamma-HCH transport system substrate-binding protein